jgi:hypothetical protein
VAASQAGAVPATGPVVFNPVQTGGAPGGQLLPPGCNGIAESVYMTSSINPGYDAGFVDLWYDSCTRSVWTQVGSYLTGCNGSGGAGCGYGYLDRSDFAQKTCSFQGSGDTGCTTPSLYDGGYTSYSVGEVNEGLYWYSGVTGSY